MLDCAKIAAIVALVDVEASVSTGTGARVVTVVVVIGGRITLHHFFLFPLLAFFSIASSRQPRAAASVKGLAVRRTLSMGISSSGKDDAY